MFFLLCRTSYVRDFSSHQAWAAHPNLLVFYIAHYMGVSQLFDSNDESTKPSFMSLLSTNQMRPHYIRLLIEFLNFFVVSDPLLTGVNIQAKSVYFP